MLDSIGNYHGASSRYITVLEAVQDRMEGRGRVLYSEGCHLWRDRLEHLAQPDDRLAEARAVAELLFGDVSPSGKLPVTFYRDSALSEMPDFTDYSMRNRTYKYYTGTPLYPFGYGLSYADIALTDLRADRESALVTLENRSEFAAEQVVQLYLRCEGDAAAPTNGALVGFARVRLAPGERREAALPLSDTAFTVVDEDDVRRPGRGRWTLYAGFGQPDARTQELSGQVCRCVSIL